MMTIKTTVHSVQLGLMKMDLTIYRMTQFRRLKLLGGQLVSKHALMNYIHICPLKNLFEIETYADKPQLHH
jgi:hypothetical protein